MKIDWTILVIIIIAAITLIVFLVRRNWKDEKKFEHRMNEDYKRPDVDEPEI